MPGVGRLLGRRRPAAPPAAALRGRHAGSLGRRIEAAALLATGPRTDAGVRAGSWRPGPHWRPASRRWSPTATRSSAPSRHCRPCGTAPRRGSCWPRRLPAREPARPAGRRRAGDPGACRRGAGPAVELRSRPQGGSRDRSRQPRPPGGRAGGRLSRTRRGHRAGCDAADRAGGMTRGRRRRAAALMRPMPGRRAGHAGRESPRRSPSARRCSGPSCRWRAPRRRRRVDGRLGHAPHDARGLVLGRSCASRGSAA